MGAVEERHVPVFPARSLRFLVVCITVLSVLAGLLAMPFLAVLNVPAAVIVLAPFAVAGALFFLWNTHAGLCFAAFAIAPLGIVQYEAAGVTINLPEALILVLFAKEALRFAAGREQLPSFVPVRVLVIWAVVNVLGVATGLLGGHGAVRVLQDFRQFTEYVVLYLLVAQRVKSPHAIAQILGCFVAGGTIIGIHGIMQQFTGIGIPLNQALSDAILHDTIRSGSFYGSTPLGSFMVLTTASALGLMLYARSRTVQFALGVCAAACVVAAIYTNTRASWLAMALALGFMFISVRKSPTLMILALAACVAFTIALGPRVVKRMETLSISKAESSLLDRVNYYTAAGHIFREHPVFGLGYGGYFSIKEIMVNRRFVPSLHRPETWDATTATVHSAYLQILVKTGLLGLAGAVAFILHWLRAMLRTRRTADRAQREYGLFIGIVAALLGYLFHIAFENFFQWPVMAQAFWLLLGLSTVLAAQLRASLDGGTRFAASGAARGHDETWPSK